jgi:hypothetical protein
MTHHGLCATVHVTNSLNVQLPGEQQSNYSGLDAKQAIASNDRLTF